MFCFVFLALIYLFLLAVKLSHKHLHCLFLGQMADLNIKSPVLVKVFIFALAQFNGEYLHLLVLVT